MNKMYKEGGLATDGVDTDPVSGNDVPAGSNAEDVRDDVDAKLSSGEYVVPADVVKYFGVAHFEKLREKAKLGLEGMDDDGRIGGSAHADSGMDVDMAMMGGYADGGAVAASPYGYTPDFSSGLETGPNMTYTGSDFPIRDFNPYAHNPGFSAETSTTKVAPTSVPSGPSAPTILKPTCPEGYTYDASNNTCVPKAPTIVGKGTIDTTKTVDTTNTGFTQAKDNDNDDPLKGIDPNRWMEKYDYSNPETLVEQSMNTLGSSEKEKGLLGQLGDLVSNRLSGGLLGKVITSQKHAETLANAAVLESQGFQTEAAAVREAAANFAKEKNIKIGGFFDSTKSLTKAAVNKYGSETGGVNTKNAQAQAEAAAAAAAYVPPTSSVRPPTIKRPTIVARPEKGTSTSKAAPVSDAVKAQVAAVTTKTPLRKSSGGRSSYQESTNRAVASRRAMNASKVAASEKAQGSGPSKSGGRTTSAGKETYSSKVSRGGGFDKGGLVSKPVEKTEAKATKPKTTKKGLGRK